LLRHRDTAPRHQHLLALAEVALPLTDYRRRGGALGLLPDLYTVVLAEAGERPVQVGNVDVAVGEHRGGDDLAGQWLFPQLPAVGPVEGRQVVPTVPAAVGVDLIDATAGHRRHAHQRVAQPLLPQRLARGGEDLQLATLGVEGDAALVHDGGGGAVVFGLVLPQDVAGSRIEGVEVIAAKAAPEEGPPRGPRGRSHRPLPGDGHFPAVPPAVLALPGDRWRDARQIAAQFRVDFHD